MNNLIVESDSVQKSSWKDSEFSLERLIESFLITATEKEHQTSHTLNSIKGSIATIMMGITAKISIEDSRIIIQMISKNIISVLIEILKLFNLLEHPIMEFVTYLKDNEGLERIPCRKTVNDLIDKKRNQPIEEIQEVHRNKIVKILQDNKIIENNIHITGDTHCRELETKERSKNVRGIMKGQKQLPEYGHHFEMTQLTNVRIMLNADILSVAPYTLGNNIETPLNLYLEKSYQQLKELGLRNLIGYYDRGYISDEFFAKIYLGHPNYPLFAVIPHQSGHHFGKLDEKEDPKFLKMREDIILNDGKITYFIEYKLIGSQSLERIPFNLRQYISHTSETEGKKIDYHYRLAYVVLFNKNCRSELRDNKTMKETLIEHKNGLESLKLEREKRIRTFNNALLKHCAHKTKIPKTPKKFNAKPNYKSKIINKAYRRVQIIDIEIKKEERMIKTLISSVQLYTVAFNKQEEPKLTEHFLTTVCLQYEKRFGIECTFLVMKEHFQIPHHYSPGNSIRELSHITLEYMMANYFRLSQLRCLYDFDNSNLNTPGIVHKTRPAFLNQQPSKNLNVMPTIIEFKAYWCQITLKNWFNFLIQDNFNKYKKEGAMES
jgi:hypothetical protein